MNSATLQIRLSQEDKERLRAIADVRGRHMSSVIKDMIAEQYFKLKSEGRID